MTRAVYTPSVRNPGSTVRRFAMDFVMNPAASRRADESAISTPTIVRLIRPTRSADAELLGTVAAGLEAQLRARRKSADIRAKRERRSQNAAVREECLRLHAGT